METCEKAVSKNMPHCLHDHKTKFQRHCCWCGKRWVSVLSSKQPEGHGEFAESVLESSWKEVTNDNSTT